MIGLSTLVKLKKAIVHSIKAKLAKSFLILGNNSVKFFTSTGVVTQYFREDESRYKHYVSIVGERVVQVNFQSILNGAIGMLTVVN